MEDNELNSKCELPTESPVKHTSISTFRPTIKEQLKIFCKPTYQVRKPKSKGAIVIILRSFLVVSLFYYIGGVNTPTHLLLTLWSHSIIRTMVSRRCSWTTESDTVEYKDYVGGFHHDNCQFCNGTVCG